MRRSFYIGARAVLQLIAEQDFSKLAGTLAVRRDYVNSLVEEVADFANHVNTGRG